MLFPPLSSEQRKSGVSVGKRSDGVKGGGEASPLVSEQRKSGVSVGKRSDGVWVGGEAVGGEAFYSSSSET